MMFKFYIWVMGWSGRINTWAWNKQVNIVRAKQRKEEEDYLIMVSSFAKNKKSEECMEFLKSSLGTITKKLLNQKVIPGRIC